MKRRSIVWGLIIFTIVAAGAYWYMAHSSVEGDEVASESKEPKVSMDELTAPPGLPGSLLGKDANRLPSEIEYLAGGTVGTAEDDDLGISILLWARRGFVVLEQFQSRGIDGIAQFKVIDTAEFDASQFDVEIGCWHPESKFKRADVIDQQSASGEVVALTTLEPNGEVSANPKFVKAWIADAKTHRFKPLADPSQVVCPESED
jgi:hypothetical protein